MPLCRGRLPVSAPDAVAQGLAAAKVYAFATADYPGAAQSLVFDSDGTSAVGAFIFDPSSSTLACDRVHFHGRELTRSSPSQARPQASPRASMERA